MKLMAGTVQGMDTPSVFAVIDDHAVLLAEGAGDMHALIASTAAGAPLPQPGADAQRYPLDAVTPSLPVSRPGKTLCIGLNFAEHAREGGNPIPDYPAIFMRAHTSLVPAGGDMIVPTVSDRFDYETELMVVVGRGGRHIPAATALDHVFGYTCFNDGSVRDYQRKSPQWTPGKNFDATGAVGPIVVTSDELPEGAHGLGIRTRLNGQTMQDSTTADMIFSVARTLEIISEVMTLEPGDLIAFGTPQGVGYARTPPVFMKPGDIVEVEIDGIGTCRNPIVAEAG